MIRSGNTTTDAQGRIFIYDAENKQIEVRDSQQNVIGQYIYDGEGKRIKKLVPSSGEVTIFVYNAGGQLVAEYSTEISQDPKVSYTTADHLGSPRILTDENGATISRRDFHPFGEEVFTSERTAALGYQPDDVRQKFTTYERDSETDLDFAQARYFSSGFGRFSSPDPLYFQFAMAIDPQRFNLYGYARNNPLKWTDPNGERLYLRGNVDWLRRNILYEMAGNQELFDKYFQITDGQVVLREGVDLTGANTGIQELAALVNSSSNYLYFAGTDGNEAADLFDGSRDSRGRRTTLGTERVNRFEGNTPNRRGGTLVGTRGRAHALQPVNLPNGDPVFCVIAYNTNAVLTQVAPVTEHLFPGSSESALEGPAQFSGVGQTVRPVSYFIHESSENLVFENLGPSTGDSEKMGRDYNIAHPAARQREAVIRKELQITGGFSGGMIRSTVPRP